VAEFAQKIGGRPTEKKKKGKKIQRRVKHRRVKKGYYKRKPRV